MDRTRLQLSERADSFRKNLGSRENAWVLGTSAQGPAMFEDQHWRPLSSWNGEREGGSWGKTSGRTLSEVGGAEASGTEEWHNLTGL